MSALEDMRAAVRSAAPGPARGVRKRAWREPEAGDFVDGHVLAFDQTLTKTGWVDLEVDHSSEFPIRILHGGVIVPTVEPDLKGFEQTFAKAEELGYRLECLLELFDLDLYDAVVHEMPAVQGYRVESSLMAAREVRRVAWDQILNGMMRCQVVMLGRQAAYTTLVGSPSAPKAELTKAVNRLIPDYCRSTSRWTQDVHDAAGLALKYLHEGTVR